jgi:hypothetical protein
MAQNTYPDGFPLTPLEAIDFSYTFSNEEKIEWREWVKTATPEQQQELVDTLHAIWTENQKEVIPTGFDKKSEIIDIVEPAKSEMQNVQPVNNEPELAPTPISKAPTSEAVKPSVELQTEIKTVEPIVEKVAETPILEAKPTVKEFVFNETPVIEAPVQAIAEQKPRQQFNNDQQKNNQQPRQQNQNQNQNQQSNQGNYNQNNRNSNQSQQQNQNQQRPEQNQNQNQNQSAGNPRFENKPKQEMNYFDFAKVRESASRSQLETLQKEYISARQQKFELEEKYSSQLTNLTNSMEQKQLALFDKVAQISLNFETVNDYLQLMTEKLLATNENNIILEKKVRSLEIMLENKVKDLTYEKENTQHDIDRLFREARELREGLRGEISDIKRASTESSVDTFGGDGLKLKIDILNNKLTALENAAKTQNNNIKQLKAKEQPRQNEPQQTNEKKQNRKTEESDRNSDGTLDISDIV